METKQICARIEAMRTRSVDRDRRQRDILAIREGRYDDVAPGILPDEFDKPLVSNLIDTAAHDLSEVMAPLPSVSCASSSQTSERAKKFANKRALIANSYIERSRLSEQMYLGADRYGSFGYMAYIVEPDFTERTPLIRVDDSLAQYFTLDHRGKTRQYVVIYEHYADELALIYPDLADQLHAIGQRRDDHLVEIAHWYDNEGWALLEVDQQLVLESGKHPVKGCPVRIVKRPGVKSFSDTRGQFDDVIWVQIARAMVAAYTMDALEQSVHAPMALPADVDELDMGPNATLVSQTPEKIGRVPLNLPNGLFPEQQMLEMAQRGGMRYPEARTGNVDASIVTGQGVQALMGTFDTQTQTFQRINAMALQDVISMCFEMDEKLWPNDEQTVRVRDEGSPVVVTYTPSKDIAGDYSVDCSYGAIARLDPNRALIFLLQAVSGGFISRETGRKYLPVELDQVAEEKRMGREMFRESLTASVAALAQAIPMMASQGQDPRQVVTQLADVIKNYERGDSIEEAVMKVFAPKEDKNAQQAPQDPLAALLAGGAPPGGAPPGGAPMEPEGGSAGTDLLMMMAGQSPSGNPNLQANVSQVQPAR